MPRIRVKGKSADSGNPRNRQYLAKSASEAQFQAEKDGIVVASVEEIAGSQQPNGSLRMLPILR
jgi:hypothetical protein